MEELKEAVVKAAKEKDKRRIIEISYGKETDELIAKIERILQKDEDLTKTYPARWLAIKVLEADEEVLKIIEKSPCIHEIINLLLEMKR